MATTTTADLIAPEILAPIIQQKYQEAMVFTPLAVVDRTLEGKPGDTLKQPMWKPIDAAQEVAEGQAIPESKGEQGFTMATVKKFGRAYSFTDESDIERIGQQVEYGTSEVSRVIAQYADTLMMNEALKVKNTLTIDPTVLGVDEVVNFFGAQKPKAAYTIICSPKTKIWFDKDILNYTRGSDTGAKLVLDGAVPSVFGASFYTTNKMTDGKAVAVFSSPDDIRALKELEEGEKTGKDPKELATLNTGQAFKYLMKRDLLIESDRDKSKQINTIYGTQIAAPYVQNPSKVLNLTVNDPSTPKG